MEKMKTVDIHEIFKDKDFIRACKKVFETGKASTALLQRQFGWGYSKASTYLEYMADFGYISVGISNRKVLSTLEVFKDDAKENFFIDN